MTFTLCSASANRLGRRLRLAGARVLESLGATDLPWPILMAIGGAISLSDRRLRIAAGRRVAAWKPAAAE